MKKGTKYAVMAAVAIVVGFISFFLIKSNKLSIEQSALWALAPVLIVVVIGIAAIEKKHKEHYDDDVGCNQTVNIYQNCRGPNPSPPPDGPVNKSDIVKWLISVDPQLTSTCQDCIANNAVKMWKQADLTNVKNMSKKKKKVVLNALLVIDCNKQCIIPPSGLDRSKVQIWVSMVGKELSVQCQTCVVDSIMKLWSPSDFVKAQLGMKEEQAKLLQGVLAFNCSKCDVNKLNPADVQKWINTILTGAKPDCYTCVVNTAVNLWNVEDFAKIEMMDKKSQVQVVQALIALNCEKDCVSVPSGLTVREAQEWLVTILVGESPTCDNCIVQAIVKNWSRSILDTVKSKPKDDQLKIVQVLLALNCDRVCHPSSNKLTKEDIQKWLVTMMPDVTQKCSDCIVNSAFSTWSSSMPTKEAFRTELLSKKCSDQVKIAKSIGAFNCPPGTCNTSPLNPCN